MPNGLHLLASLDGAPLDPRDAHVLELDAEADAGVRRMDGCRLRLGDANAGAVSVSQGPDDLVAVLGWFDEPEALASRLGLQGRPSAAELGREALGRFGDDAPAWIDGEWTLVRWSTSPRRLEVATSFNRRDDVFYAADHGRVALSTDLRRLARIRNVDTAWDVVGIAMPMARARLRRVRDDRTIYAGVKQFAPAERTAFDRTGVRRVKAARRPPLEWRGDFDDALDAIETLLRRIVRTAIQREGDLAFFMSGGLDSSLLGWLGVEERRAEQAVIFVTSVSPPGSGASDEAEYARMVARSMDVPIREVWPPAACNAMRPSTACLQAMQQPSVPIYHHLFEALYGAAGDATAVVSGSGGEMTVTATLEPGLEPSTLLRPRQLAALARRSLIPQRRQGRWPKDAFHVRIAPALAGRLPAELEAEWRRPLYVPAPTRPRAPVAVHPGLDKLALPSTSTFRPGLRRLTPFRDARLVRLVGGMPAGYLARDGRDRALARALLARRLPEELAFRPHGMPFSPGYPQRLVEDAPAALHRLPVLREQGVGDWIDLPWLEIGLRRLAAGEGADIGGPHPVQLTACMAEAVLRMLEGAARS